MSFLISQLLWSGTCNLTLIFLHWIFWEEYTLQMYNIIESTIVANKYAIWTYSARRLIGSRIIESAAYSNQILLVPLYLNSTQNTSVNWIIRLMLSLLCWPKAILLSGGHCIWYSFQLVTIIIKDWKNKLPRPAASRN